MNKVIIILMIFLAVPAVLAEEVINIKTLPEQTIAGSNLVKTSEGYSVESNQVTVLSWWDNLILYFKGILGLQAVYGSEIGNIQTLEITPEEFGAKWNSEDQYWEGKVAAIGERKYLSASNPSASFDEATQIPITFVDKTDNKVKQTNINFGALVDFRPTAYEGDTNTVVNPGVVKFSYDHSGYVTVDESTGTVKWNKYSGQYHAPSEDWVTKYDFYVDREGFDVEFSDERNLVILRDAPMDVPLTFTNNIAEGILCSAEITIKYTGFYTQDIKNILPAKKCSIGKNTLIFPLNVSQLGVVEVSAIAVLYQPSYTKFYTSGLLSGCSEKYPCKYWIGNETIVDDHTVMKKYEVLSQSAIQTSPTAEVFKTIQ